MICVHPAKAGSGVRKGEAQFFEVIYSVNTHSGSTPRAPALSCWARDGSGVKGEKGGSACALREPATPGEGGSPHLTQTRPNAPSPRPLKRHVQLRPHGGDRGRAATTKRGRGWGLSCGEAGGPRRHVCLRAFRFLPVLPQRTPTHGDGKKRASPGTKKQIKSGSPPPPPPCPAGLAPALPTGGIQEPRDGAPWRTLLVNQCISVSSPPLLT